MERFTSSRVCEGIPSSSPPLAKDKNKKNRKDAKRAYIGIDIGGTKSLYALFGSRFEVLAEEKLRTHPDKGGVRAFTAAMKGALGKLMREAKRRKLEVRYAGAGCAGDIDLKTGTIRHSPNLAILDGYALHDTIERATGAKVFVGHDVQAALYGEFRHGVARKARHVIGVWIGT